MCKEWRHDFAAFLRDMGERPSKAHSLDRYPNQSGPYAPHNCRWATHREQHNNIRTNHLLRHAGKTHTVAEWARITGLHYTTILGRLAKHWTVRDALTIAVMPRSATRRGHAKFPSQKTT
jgi:hypothetical protein